MIENFTFSLFQNVSIKVFKSSKSIYSIHFSISLNDVISICSVTFPALIHIAKEKYPIAFIVSNSVNITIKVKNNLANIEN